MGDLAGAASLGAALDDPAADGDLTARAVGAWQPSRSPVRAASTKAGDYSTARLPTPSRRCSATSGPPSRATTSSCPAAASTTRSCTSTRRIAAFERADPFGRLPYALLFKFAIHEERGEDQAALALAARGRDLARQTGLAGWLGAGTSIRIASLLVRMGDIAGAEAELAGVGPEWHARRTWEHEATRAALAAARGEARAARSAAERAERELEGDWPWFDRMRCAAVLAPVLVRAGQPSRARAHVEATLAARPPGFSGARLTAVLAWLRYEEGDEGGSVAALAAACEEAGDQARHVLRREWPRVERPLWLALEHEALDPEAAVGAVAEVLPGGAALGPFTRHPVAGVRRAALLSAVAAGHPEGIARLSDFEGDSDPGVAAAARAAADRLRRHPPPLAFRLFGAFELRRGAWVVQEAEWTRRVAVRLVRLLLCRGGRPVADDELIEAFWPDKPVDAARRSLQVAVSAARGVLDAPGAESSRILAAEHSYRLSLGAEDSVDASEFERASATALSAGGAGRRAALLAAAALWGGEPLPEERYADWAIPWRERLIDRHAEVLAALIDVHADAGDLVAAAEVARRLVDLDPVNEVAHRQLIVAYARVGQRGHALRQYLACRRALVAELGIEPGEETAELQRRVLAGEPV